MPRHSRILVLSFVCCLLVSTGFAQQPAATNPKEQELTELYNAGMSAFNAGDYKSAIASFKTLTTKSSEEDLEPALFPLGAAYYNVKDFKNAAATFERIIQDIQHKKFKDNSRLAEAEILLATTQIANHQGASAVNILKRLENDPKLRDKALLTEATAFKGLGQTDQAIEALKKLIGAGIQNEAQATGALTLTQLYADKDQAEEAMKVFDLLQQNIDQVKNVVELNNVAAALGDKFAAIAEQKKTQDLEAAKKDLEFSIAAYRSVRSAPEIIAIQKQRIQAMKDQVQHNIDAMTANPTNRAAYVSKNDELNKTIGEYTSMLTDFEKKSDFTGPLWLRLARSYFDLGRRWEAVVVYDEVIKLNVPADTEPAMFGLIVSLTDLGQTKEALAEADEYLKQFPKGSNAKTVGYMRGVISIQAKDYATAVKYFGDTLAREPKGDYHNKIQYLLAGAYFAEGKFAEADAAYALYAKEAGPKAEFTEDSYYRSILCKLFMGKYQDALDGFNAYLKKYPKGQYVSDAKYRIGVCYQAAKMYDKVIKGCQQWIAEYPNDASKGDVLALLGDAYDSQNEKEKAIESYIKSYKAASSEEVVNYSLFAAARLMQKLGQWDRMAKSLQEFVKNNPESQTSVTALYWLATAKAKNGKADEAKQILADSVKKFITDRSSDAVDQVLTLLAQLCAKRPNIPLPPPPPTPAHENASNGNNPPPASTPTPTPAPTPKPYDAMADLTKYLNLERLPNTPLVRARYDYTTAQLAKLTHDPAKERNWMLRMIADATPEKLSALLLAQAGDFLLQQNDPDKAATYFQELSDTFPKSDFLDYAYNGLGQVAYDHKDYTKALKWYDEAINKLGAPNKLKEVTIGKARALLALNRLDEAKKVFTEVASTRSWRGPDTAESIYNLGAIAQKQNKMAEAINLYQTVFVSYQRYLPWVAKSYIASANCFIILGKEKDAIRTYQEMLRNPKLADLPEAKIAQQQLQKLSPQ